MKAGNKIKNCLTCKRYSESLTNCSPFDKRELRKLMRKEDFKKCKYYKYDKKRELWFMGEW